MAVSRHVPTLEESIEDSFSVHGIDKNDAKILGFTFKSPRTMLTISTVLGTPIVECYKRAGKLMSLGLLKRFRLTSVSSIPGIKEKVFYTADASRVEVVVVNGRSKVKVRRRGVPDGSVFQFAIVF